LKSAIDLDVFTAIDAFAGRAADFFLARQVPWGGRPTVAP
jgi:hypothetical protein